MVDGQPEFVTEGVPEARVEDASWAGDVVATPTVWQRVIHGASDQLRKRYVAWALERGDDKRAKAYAMCGMGDEVVEKPGLRYRVAPKRCGNRFCPRCSRYHGLRFVKHVSEHLAMGAHGCIHHLVLTQVVKPRETLIACRERFEKKWTRFWVWASRGGLLAGIRTTHITWSRHGGWHLHAHVMIEFEQWLVDTEERVEGLLQRWQEKVTAEGNGKAAEMFGRKVCEAGERFQDSDEEQGEFWVESEDAVAKVVQYCVRDVCQGVESWNLAEAGQRIEELFSGVACAKLHRLLGAWRETAKQRFDKEPPKEEVKDDGKSAVDIVGGEISVGTVDTVYYRALEGDRVAVEMLRCLLNGLRNASLVAERLLEAFKVVAR